MATLFPWSCITDFPEAWCAAVCCKVDVERDAARLNIPFWGCQSISLSGADAVKALWRECRRGG